MAVSLFAGNVNAQRSQLPYKPQFGIFNNKNGLSQGFVSDIMQDKTGFLWFATKDGLNKYDGYHITIYRYNPDKAYSLPDNSVAHVCEDDAGNFWVGTRNKGLFLFDRLHERFYPIQREAGNKVLNNPVSYLIAHGQKLLVGDYNDLCIYDIAGITPKDGYPHPPARITKRFSFNDAQHLGGPGADARLLPILSWLPDNSLWKASPDSVFICVPDASQLKWRVLRKPMSDFGLKPQRQFAVFPGAAKEQVIIVGSSALIVFDRQANRIVYRKELNDRVFPLIDYFSREPFALRDGSVMYYDADGFHCFDPHSLLHKDYGKEDPLSKSGFAGLVHYEDNDGTLWIGSGGYGIYTYHLRAERFRKYPHDASGFIEGDPQHMYFNFRTGAARFNILDRSTEPVIPAALWQSDWMNPLVYCRSTKGDLWVQVESKSRKCYLLFKYDVARQRLDDFTGIRYNDPDGQLLTMFTDSKDRLWQLCYDADRTRKFIVCDGMHPRITATYRLPLPPDVNKVSSFLNSTFEDAQGYLWFSTNLGLFRFDTMRKQWKHFKNNPLDAASLSGDIIFSVCPDPGDPGNILWVGTNGRGLNRMDLRTGKCKRYDEADGLPNNVVYGLLNDAMGNLWISTNQGLSCFNRKQETFRNYTDEDGLMGNEFNRGQFFRSSKGLLFFGGVDGLTWFDPKEVLASAQASGRIAITGFALYNKTVDFKQDSSLFQQAIQYTNTITLSAAQNMFTIEFALLQFSGADKKRYQYLLDGFDKNWIDNGNKNAATFTNLDPGEYTFRVKGRNSDGVWSSNIAELKIIILTPWYATWWFTAIWCLSLVASLYGFYRYRLTQSLKVISMRNRIATDLHDEIGSTISSISVYSDILEDKLSDIEMKQIAARISNSSRNILVVMSDIVWSINPKNDRFDNVILRMKSFAHEVLEAQEKTVHFESDPKLDELRMQMNDRKNFYLIFKESLNNVVKYANAKHVWIQISLQGHELHFMIRDDGVGFDLSAKKEGNGLLNMQQRSRDLNGELVIRSAPGKGTEVILHFPVH